MGMIPYGHQDIDQDDIQAVVEVLRSDWLTQGPAVERFEDAVASYCGASHAAAMCNATSALHLACLAIGLGPGDFLWTSPNTFVASANCALYCGAEVDFVDIDSRTYNMSVEALEKKLAEAEQRGRLPKAVVPVHFAGLPCDMEEIHRLAQSYGFQVIEDASHAVGSSYRDKKTGGCAYSDMTVFSFHPVKIITTGEGGMVLSNSTELHQRLKLLRSHGVTRDPALMEDAGDGPWVYQQVALGANHRLPDILAALGASQMSRVDEFVARRHALAARYDEAFKDLPLQRPWRSADSHSAFHLYVVRLDFERSARGRGEVFQALQDAGIGVNVHYIPVHTQPYYRKLGFRPGDFPAAERYYEEAITLPLYPALSEEDQDRVIAALHAALG